MTLVFPIIIVETVLADDSLSSISTDEKKYPSTKEPMGDVIQLQADKYSCKKFDTQVGNYQDYAFTAKQNGIYALSTCAKTYAWAGTTLEDYKVAMEITDEQGNVIKPLEDKSSGINYRLILYLRAGKTYTIRLLASEDQVKSYFMIDPLSVCISSAKDIYQGVSSSVYYITTDAYESPWAVIYKVIPEEDNTYYVTNDITGRGNDGIFYQYVYEEDGQVLTRISETEKESVKLHFMKNKTYYIFVSVRRTEENEKKGVNSSVQGSIRFNIFGAEEKAAATQIVQKYNKAKTTAQNIRVKNPKTKAKAKKKAQVTWKAASGVAGYEIQYGTKKNFKKVKTVTVKGGNKKKVILKKLKAGKKYFIRIRPFTKVTNLSGRAEKIYGKWSKTMKIKAKN